MTESGKEKMSGAAVGASVAVGKKDETVVVSDEVRQTLEKGMRIISDIEQTRPDGMVFKFELDLMYEVSYLHGVSHRHSSTVNFTVFPLHQ